jgi:hypothetical protein
MMRLIADESSNRLGLVGIVKCGTTGSKHSCGTEREVAQARAGDQVTRCALRLPAVERSVLQRSHYSIGAEMV